MADHAYLSPSSAGTWTVCPGMPSAVAGLARSGSIYSARGTVAHGLLESHLTEKKRLGRLVGTKVTEDGFEVTIDAEMVKQVMDAASWVKKYMKKHPTATLLCEQRAFVGAAFGRPDDIWGTADIVILDWDASVLVVADLKTGHHYVEVERNLQLMLYAIGMQHHHSGMFGGIKLVILQPSSDEPAREWDCSAADLDAEQRRIKPLVDRACDPAAPRVASADGCRWCPAAGACPEAQARSLELAKRDLMPDVTTLGLPDLVLLLDKADQVRSALDAAEEHALRLLQSGAKIEGWKVVESKRRRVWNDEEKAYTLLTQLGYGAEAKTPPKLITPPQAENLVGKANRKHLEPLIESPAGGPTLARESDRRPALGGDFDAVEDDLIGEAAGPVSLALPAAALAAEDDLSL